MKGLPRSQKRAITRSGATRGMPLSVSIPLRAFTIVIADPGAAVAFASAVMGDFPAGRILFLGAAARFRATKGDGDIIDAFTGNFSVGSTATADATLSGTDANLIPSTALQTGSGGVSSSNVGASTATESGTILNNDDGSLEMNFNVTIADASISAASSLVLDGEMLVSFMVL